MNEAWWDPAARGQEEATNTEVAGGYRRLHTGRFYALGEFPTGEPPMFDPAIAPPGIDEVPPEDQAPDYPSPAED